MASDITDVLLDQARREFYPDTATGFTKEQVAKLAAATSSGPLVEDVTCPTCGGGGTVDAPCSEPTCPHPVHGVCPVCHGSGTVRIVVHRADPALVERLTDLADDLHLDCHSLHGAGFTLGDWDPEPTCCRWQRERHDVLAAARALGDAPPIDVRALRKAPGTNTAEGPRSPGTRPHGRSTRP